MKKYHLNPETGVVSVCRANVRSCQYGESNHFGDAVEASRHYESHRDAFETKHKTMFELNKSLTKVVDALRSEGFRPVIVGGSVRDRFLGQDSKDIDIEVYGDVNGESIDLADLSKTFSKISGVRANEAGVSFAVLKLSIGKEEVDLSLPRTEKTTGEGHRDYDIDSDSRLSFEEASSRRDFTLNSMGVDLTTGKLLDPHGGRRDLEKGVLRHVSDAFSDDPLRCLRAVNFVSRFGFDVAPETAELCRSLSSSYSSLSSERIEEEMNKVFSKGEHCKKAMRILKEIGWSEKMPGLSSMSGEQMTTIGERMDKAPKGVLRKAVFVHSIDEKDRAKAFTYVDSASRNRTIINDFSRLADSVTQEEIVANHRALKKRAPELSNSAVDSALKAVGSTCSIGDLPETPDPPILTGDYLLSRGLKQGKELGAILRKAQLLQDRGVKGSPDELFEIVSKGES